MELDSVHRVHERNGLDRQLNHRIMQQQRQVENLLQSFQLNHSGSINKL